MVEFLRHPVTLFALYDLITAISTMLKAFWFVHAYKPAYNGGNSENDKFYRVSWAWGVLAGVSIFMTFLLFFALLTKSRIWAIVWSWWELGYIIAYTVLSIIAEQVCWKQNMKAMQYLYMFFPRVFGLVGIILVVSYAMGPWKQRDRRGTTSTNYERQVNDLPDVTADSTTEVRNK